MKVFHHFKGVLTLTAIFVVASLNSGCDYAKKVIAKDKVNQGAIFYNQGRTKEAQQFFKDAIDWDQSSPMAQLYYGATLVKDYKNRSGDDRLQVANQALGVYRKALDLSNGNCKIQDNAISYIATIYDDLEKPDEWREWMLRRADGN